MKINTSASLIAAQAAIHNANKANDQTRRQAGFSQSVEERKSSDVNRLNDPVRARQEEEALKAKAARNQKQKPATNEAQSFEVGNRASLLQREAPNALGNRVNIQPGQIIDILV